jgi:hypothetical protein
MGEHLEALVRLLRENGENLWAVMVEDAMTGSQAGLDAFLASNELWGGSGSIADGAGGGQRSEGRRRIERILIQLGKEQMRTGNLNPRTEMFSKWQEEGI